MIPCDLLAFINAFVDRSFVRRVFMALCITSICLPCYVFGYFKKLHNFSDYNKQTKRNNAPNACKILCRLEPNVDQTSSRKSLQRSVAIPLRSAPSSRPSGDCKGVELISNTMTVLTIFGGVQLVFFTAFWDSLGLCALCLCALIWKEKRGWNEAARGWPSLMP